MSRRSAAVVFLALALLVPLPGRAMNLPSYDLVSLAFLSTDIIVANITEETPGAEDTRLIVTVESVLYGSALKRGDRLDRLTPFLEDFHPLAGMRAIVFLNSEPHNYNFPYQDMKTPYAVVPDGVLLIDAYGHVHRYAQLWNPGGYTAEGWPMLPFRGPKREPTREEDLKLPSLDQERAALAKTLAEVAPVLPLLKRPARREDMPALLHLLDRTSDDDSDCPLRMAQAITESAEHQVFSLNDPELMLAAYIKSGGFWTFASSFNLQESFFNIPDKSGQMSRDAGAARVRMLADALLDHGRDLTTRMGAASLIKADYTSNQSLPTDAMHAAETVFKNSNEDPMLRGLALALLLPGDALGRFNNQDRIHDPTYVEDARLVYKSLPSGVAYDSLRFAIETQLLSLGDSYYDSLSSKSGQAPFLIGLEPTCGCDPERGTGPVLLVERRERLELVKRREALLRGPRWDWRLVLTGVADGRRFPMSNLKEIGGSIGSSEAWMAFRLTDPPTGVPPGDYWLSWRESIDGQALNSGYPARITISDVAGEKHVTVDLAQTPQPLLRWPW